MRTAAWLLDYKHISSLELRSPWIQGPSFSQIMSPISISNWYLTYNMVNNGSFQLIDDLNYRWIVKFIKELIKVSPWCSHFPFKYSLPSSVILSFWSVFFFPCMCYNTSLHWDVFKKNIYYLSSFGEFCILTKVCRRETNTCEYMSVKTNQGQTGGINI